MMCLEHKKCKYDFIIFFILLFLKIKYLKERYVYKFKNQNINILRKMENINSKNNNTCHIIYRFRTMKQKQP